MSTPAIDLDVSDLAKRVGLWIAQTSELGLEEPIDGEQIEKAFEGETTRDLEDGLAELEAEGLLTTTPLMNTNLPHVNPTLDLFAVFDPVAIGSDPFVDAGELLDVILGERMESVGVPDLHTKIDWKIRRFNPAIGYVISLIGEGRVSGEMGSHPYAVRYFHVAAEDRVAMRQFLKRIRG